MDEYRNYFQPSQLTHWQETDKPKMADFNRDNQQLNEQALWKVVYDPRGLERDAFAEVYSEVDGSTVRQRVVEAPNASTLAKLTDVPFYVRALNDGVGGSVTLTLWGQGGANLGTHNLNFPAADGVGLSTIAPAGWVRTGGVYQLVLDTDGQLVVLNPQVQAASTTAPGVVQLNDTLHSNSTTRALTAAQGKALEDGKVDRTQIVQTTGTSATDIMSQAAVGDALDALDERKVNHTQVVQQTGTSATNVMSQAAVTAGLEEAMTPASTTNPGIVQLSNALDSDSDETAATSKALKLVYEEASATTSGIEALIEQAMLTHTKKLHPVGSYYISSSATNPSSIFGFGTWALTNLGEALVGVNTADTDFNTPGKAGGSKTVSLAATNLPSHSHAATGLAATVASGGAHTHTTTVSNDNVQHTHGVSITSVAAGGHSHPYNSPPWFAGEITSGGFIYAESSSTAGSFVARQTGSVNNHTHAVNGTSAAQSVYHQHTVTVNNTNSAHAHTATLSGSTAATGGNAAHNNLQPYRTAYIWKRTA